MEQKTSDSLIIFLGALTLFTVLLPPEFIAFQTRFALFAKNMLHQGISFFPMTYGRPYPDYPALPIIFIVLTSKLFHHLTPLTLILPTALFSAAILVVIYRIGALQNRWWGIYGVLLALLTDSFVTEARSVALDQYISFASVLCFYLIYSADLLRYYKRLSWIPFLWIFGFVCRGPVGLMVPVGIVSLYYLSQKRWKAGVLSLTGGTAFLIVCLVGLISAAYCQGGSEFVKNMLFSQSIRRVLGVAGDSHRQPFYFYWLRGFLDYAFAYPIAVWVIFLNRASLKRWQPRKTDAFLFKNLCIAFLVIMMGFSIPAAKKIRYLLPIVPFISLLAAYLWAENSTISKCWQKIPMAVIKGLPYFLLGLVAMGWMLSQKYIELRLGYYYGLAAAVLMILIALQFFTAKFSEPFFVLLIGVLSFQSFNLFFIEPMNYLEEKTRPFAAELENYYHQQKQPIVFYRIGPDREDINLMANLKIPIDSPRFIQSESQLMKLSSGYVIVEQKTFNYLPPKIKQRMKILYRGWIGHSPCLVISKC